MAARAPQISVSGWMERSYLLLFVDGHPQVKAAVGPCVDVWEGLDFLCSRLYWVIVRQDFAICWMDIEVQGCGQSEYAEAGFELI